MAWAYRPEACSFTAPKGPHTAIAGRRPDAPLGTYTSAASSMPKRFLKTALLCSTAGLRGKVLSQSLPRFKLSAILQPPFALFYYKLYHREHLIANTYNECLSMLESYVFPRYNGI